MFCFVFTYALDSSLDDYVNAAVAGVLSPSDCLLTLFGRLLTFDARNGRRNRRGHKLFALPSLCPGSRGIGAKDHSRKKLVTSAFERDI